MHVESLIEHGSGVMNEDVLVMENNLFGVFDGATSLTSETYEHGLTGGFLASHRVAEEFRKNDGTLVELAERANQALRQDMLDRQVALNDKGNLWSTSAAVVRVQGDSLEWAQIGDCRIFCIHDTGKSELLCEPIDQDAETLRLWRDVCHETDAPIRVAIHQQILKVRSRMNVDYGVFNGEPEAMRFLRSGKHDLNGIKHILLFTDGLLLPDATPWLRRDFCEHIDLFRKAGLKGVHNHIRSVEATDIGCRIYPRFKTHDDIAAIAIHM
ncbi:protein phosphatase 2C domain-containing protein [Desulfovibrio inopinatus]|uniref:protein phosphatase 2C domain-containing protein n=1 Tax=Desulfovibrio inopinatus TaxID=102109 RepID=UPI0004130E04|nr:protein phosphatase 2C domain-containing protein [Desulfovibrio inopinatus]